MVLCILKIRIHHSYPIKVSMTCVNRHINILIKMTLMEWRFFILFLLFFCQQWLKRPIRAVNSFHSLSYRAGTISGSSWRKGETTLAFACPPSSALVYFLVSFSVFPHVWNCEHWNCCTVAQFAYEDVLGRFEIIKNIEGAQMTTSRKSLLK